MVRQTAVLMHPTAMPLNRLLARRESVAVFRGGRNSFGAGHFMPTDLPLNTRIPLMESITGFV